MKKVLTNEHPLVILPSLAMKIGFRVAIILQQVHYWLTKSLHIIEGRRGFITHTRKLRTVYGLGSEGFKSPTDYQ